MNWIWLFPLLCLAMMIAMMVMMFRYGMCMPFGRRSRRHVETARDVLDRRYASGEIGKEEYETRRRALLQTSGEPR